MKFKKIILILAFSVWLIGIFSGIMDVGVFIPREEYKTFSYLFSFIISTVFVFLIFVDNHGSSDTKNKKDFFIAFFGFIVIFHFYLVGMFYGFPAIFQYFTSEQKIITKNVIYKHYNSGRNGNKCYYHFAVEDSFYYGRICTDKQTLDKLNINDKIILSGRQNMFGFYCKDFKYQNIK